MPHSSLTWQAASWPGGRNGFYVRFRAKRKTFSVISDFDSMLFRFFIPCLRVGGATQGSLFWFLDRQHLRQDADIVIFNAALIKQVLKASPGTCHRLTLCDYVSPAQVSTASICHQLELCLPNLQIDSTSILMSGQFYFLSLNLLRLSLVPRPSPPPVLDRLQYAKKTWKQGRRGNKATQACLHKIS